MEYEKYLNLWVWDGGRDLMPILGFIRSFTYSLSLYVVLKIVVLFKKLKTRVYNHQVFICLVLYRFYLKGFKYEKNGI